MAYKHQDENNNKYSSSPYNPMHTLLKSHSYIYIYMRHNGTKREWSNARDLFNRKEEREKKRQRKSNSLSIRDQRHKINHYAIQFPLL